MVAEFHCRRSWAKFNCAIQDFAFCACMQLTIEIVPSSRRWIYLLLFCTPQGYGYYLIEAESPDLGFTGYFFEVSVRTRNPACIQMYTRPPLTCIALLRIIVDVHLLNSMLTGDVDSRKRNAFNIDIGGSSISKRLSSSAMLRCRLLLLPDVTANGLPG